MKMRKLSVLLGSLFLVAALAVSLAVPVMAQPPVTSPFSGTVTSNAVAAPIGTVIDVYVDGDLQDTTTTTAVGWYEVVVFGTAADVGQPVTFTVNGLTAVTTPATPLFASYQPQTVGLAVTTGATYTLTIQVTGSGSTSPPVGSYTYAETTVVALTATAASGWEFSSWSGNASGSNPATTVTMTSNKSVTANFTEEGVTPVTAPDPIDIEAVEGDTDVGPIGIAPGSTIIFAAVYEQADDEWTVQKSEDGGYDWDDTELDDKPRAAHGDIVQIGVSPNYEEDETLYVAFEDGTVYRLEEGGDATPIALKSMVDSDAVAVSALYSIDVWYDGEDNWILAGTNLDAFVLRDRVFESWRDQERDATVYEVSFAPDFDESELIWAISEDAGGDFVVISTISPGQWGQIVGEVEIDLAATQWVDLGFPDDYDSDIDSGDTILFAALTGDGADTGDVYLIEGVAAADGDSNAIALLDLSGDPSVDLMSIAVSGDTTDAVILAGATWSPTVYRSDDGGDSWDDAKKNPTGVEKTNVAMALGAFDPDEGVAFASTMGDESALSRSDDGGEVWNQVGLIDTTIDEILDLGFNPDFPDEAVFLMITYSSAHDTYSLWLTENGDEEDIEDLNEWEEVNDITFIRVLAGHVGSIPGNFNGEFELVEYAQDGEAIYIHGVNDDGDSSIWKSTDGGQRFKSERSVKSDARINDWVIADATTIYAATDDGFYVTTNSGLSWTVEKSGTSFNDIALQPGFDADDSDMDVILMGGFSGQVFVSLNAGDSWKDTGADDDLDGTVVVAFDADYPDEDLIYAADDAGNAILEGEEDGKDTEWKVLKDKENKEPVTGDFYGLVVADDNALYAIADDADYADTGDVGTFEDETGVVRLLLHASNRIWEEADDTGLADPLGLWVASGSNVLWTIDAANAELWLLEDTLSGQVTLDSPSNGYQHDREDVMRISWEELRGIDDDYEYKYTNVDPDITDSGTTDNLSILLTQLDGSSEYEWKVRAAPGEPWSSRWSGKWTFFTALGAPPWAPTLYAPSNGEDDALLTPAFSWEPAKTADSYAFMLADNGAFSSPLVDEKVSADAFTPDVTLDYSITYYWKVQAYKGNKAVSRWSDVSVFTTMSEPPPPPPPAPTPTLTVEPATPIILPTPIPPALLWTIIGIGAVLIIAVIVLITRTRRMT